MVHWLAIDHHMAIAQLPEQAFGKQAVDDLCFLKAQNIGRLLFQKAFDNVDPGADRIDIPRGDAECL
jgi:hypothetical protein